MTHIRALLNVLVAALLAITAATQDPKRPDATALVSQAESLLKQQKTEDAVLVLWRALDQIVGQPAGATNDALAAAARSLLLANDPCDAHRSAAFTAVAKQQVDLSAAYRGKKWLDTAADHLDVADRYDQGVTAKERAALDAAQKSAKEAAEKRATPSRLLTRKNVRCSFGTWREVGDCLEGPATKKGDGMMPEWITSAAHQDNQICVEFKPVVADQPHAASLWIGYTGQGASGAGISIGACYEAPTKQYLLSVMEKVGPTWTQRASVILAATMPTDGFHRLVVQVERERVSAALDDAPPIEHKADAAIRGNVGLSLSTGKSDSCAILFRNLTVEPLPRTRSLDDEARTPDGAAEFAATHAIEGAKEHLAKKQPERASRMLRSALGHVAAMTIGDPRSKLLKAIEPILVQADPLTPRAKKAAQTSASELVKAADAYASAGLLRAALQLVERAAAFDAEGQAARLVVARGAVAK